MVKIEKDIDLKKYNTYGVGGNARYFVLAKKRQDLVDAYNFAKEKNISFVVLGRGSNVLISDDDFNGLAIVNQASEFKVDDEQIKVFSGMSLPRLVKLIGEEGLTGGEFLAGIPGTLGGAILGNAGAWGKSLGDIIESVEFLDENGIKEIKKQEIDFSYRESSFKKMKGIILGATLRLNKSTKEEVEKEVEGILKKRSGKHPAGRSCGSFFKNIEITNLSPEILEKVCGWEKSGKIPSGKLIEESGCKGMKVGGAEVSEAHANFIVNTGNATATDIKELAQQVKNKVYDKFGVELEPEVRYL